MATIEKRSGGYRLVFWYQSKRFQGAVKAETRKKAEELRLRVEGNLELLQQGRLEYQVGDDLFTLMLSDGKLSAKPQVRERVNFGEFLRRFQANRPPGKESNTRNTEDIHIKHLLRLFQKETLLKDVPAKLQEYVTARAQDQVSPVTIKKELATLTSIWNRWGIREGLVLGALSLRNLDYPKQTEKPRFQTWNQIMRKTNGNPESELWQSVYLTVEEIEEFLAEIRCGASIVRGHERRFAFVYPMIAFCAYTGCRRSEMLRARVEDVDFERGELVIREKKKDRSKTETYRHVPLVPKLRTVLADWMKAHPGGTYLFCRRMDEPLTDKMASHHFRWAVDGSKWTALPGFHCMRHSLISNLATQGVSDHVIMGLVGHLNRETTKRYLHLRPQTLEAALGLLYG